MNRAKNISVTSFLASFMLAISLMSYVFWKMNAVLNGASIIMIFCYVLFSGKIPWIRVHGPVFSGIVVVFSVYMLVVGIVSSTAFSQLVVQISYAVSFLFFSFYGYKFFLEHRQSLLLIAVFIVGFSALFSVLGLLFGIGLHDNRQGFLGLPALQGLAKNSNYNVVMILISIFLALGLTRRINSLGYLLGAFLVCLILLMSGSRGATLGLAGAVSAGLLLRYLPRLAVPVFIMGALVGGTLLFTNITKLEEALKSQGGAVQGLRLEKGLNDRDLIWFAAFNVINDKPWFGWGDISLVEETMVAYGSPTTSVQNGYLMMAMRTGFVGLSLWLALIAFTALRAAVVVARSGVTREERKRIVLIFMAFIVVMVDNFFRTYTPGGVGFIPMVMGISVSFVNYTARNEWYHRSAKFS